MKKLFTIIAIAFSMMAMSQNYIVSGSFNSSENGTYTPAGTCNSKPTYTLSSGGNTYTIIWGGSYWTVGQLTGPCAVFSDYFNSSTSATVPTGSTGWGGITVTIAADNIMYSASYMAESVNDDGTVPGTTSVVLNPFTGGQGFTGSNGEDYAATGKIIFAHVPAGLTLHAIKTNNTIAVTFTGAAPANNNVNNTYVTLQFANSAFAVGTATTVINYNDSIQIFFRQQVNVSACSQYTTVSAAIAAATPFDVIAIGAGTFTDSLVINMPLTFKGMGANKTIIQANATPGAARKPVFTVNSGSVEFYDMTIQNGYAFQNSNGQSLGGGVCMTSNTGSDKLKMVNCKVSNNQAYGNAGAWVAGGGICTNGALTLQNCEISNNSISTANNKGNILGGGIFTGGNDTLRIINSTISGNQSIGTISGSLCGLGGGVYSYAVSYIVNTTVTNNSATYHSGGIYLEAGFYDQLLNSIFYGNTASSGSDVGLYSNTVIDSNCIIGGYNIRNGGTLTSVNAINANPMLSPLANNGGTTSTHALQAGSPAIDASLASPNTTTQDQRYYVALGVRDLGAFEFNGTTQTYTNYPFIGVMNNNNPQTICMGTGYTINNHTYTVAGTYKDTLVGASSHGCDSLVVTTLTVNPAPTLSVNTAAICTGATVTLTVSGTATTYTWSTSATTASISVTPSVTATYSVTSSIGNCSVTAVSTVTVTPSFTPTISITEFVPFAPFVNVATGGTATANNNYGGNDAMYAFDGDTVINGWGSASGGIPAWLAYDFGTGNNKIINEYSIFCSSQMVGGWGSSGYDPQTWTFEGFNGTTWDVLDAQIDNNPVQDIWKNYRFTNATAYQMYRINISNTFDGSYAMVTELRMGLTNVTNHNCSNQLFIAANDTNLKPFTYQWQLNGLNVGAHKDTLNLTSFHQNDMLVCVLNTTAACASTNTVTSNALTINHGPVNAIASVSSTTVTTATVAGATYQWFNCGLGNAQITGATNPTYVATANGSYAVIVTANGCADTSTCVSVTTVGIAQYGATNNLQVYPNPFSNELTIVSTTKANALLFDMLGNKINEFVLQNTTQTISLSDLAPGMYYLQVDAQKIKVIKQ